MSANIYTCQAIHIPCHNFGCVSTEVSVDSHIRELRNRGISAASLSSEDVDENNLLKGAYSFVFGIRGPSYKTRGGETCSVVMFIKTEPLQSLRVKFMLFQMVSLINPKFSLLSSFLAKMLILDRPLIFKRILQILQ